MTEVAHEQKCKQKCNRCKVNLTVDKFNMKRDGKNMKGCKECNLKTVKWKLNDQLKWKLKMETPHQPAEEGLRLEVTPGLAERTGLASRTVETNEERAIRIFKEDDENRKRAQLTEEEDYINHKFPPEEIAEYESGYHYNKNMSKKEEKEFLNSRTFRKGLECICDRHRQLLRIKNDDPDYDEKIHNGFYKIYLDDKKNA